MGFAEFLEKRFLGKMICISVCDGETQSIWLEQLTVEDREYFEGILKTIDEGIIVLEVAGEGEIYFNPDNISYVWQKPFEPHRAMKLSLSGKLNLKKRIGE
jgi:hypothetical protein